MFKYCRLYVAAHSIYLPAIQVILSGGMVKQSCAYWPFLVTEKTVLAKVLNFALIFRKIPIPEIVAAVTEINYKPQEMQAPQQQGTVGRDKLDRYPHQVQHAKQLVAKGPSQLVLEPMSTPSGPWQRQTHPKPYDTGVPPVMSDIWWNSCVRSYRAPGHPHLQGRLHGF